MPISPQEASSRINEYVIVEMLVKAAKNCPHCSQIFLDSEEDHHDPKNLWELTIRPYNSRARRSVLPGW